jgi:hypothetical protein
MEDFSFNPSASNLNTVIDEQFRAKKKILTCVLISELADDSTKKNDFFKYLIFERYVLKFFRGYIFIQQNQLNNNCAGMNIVKCIPIKKIIKKPKTRITIFGLLRALLFGN